MPPRTNIAPPLAQGDTGTRDFEAALFRGWALAAPPVPLPQWGSTACALTLWQRRPRIRGHGRGGGSARAGGRGAEGEEDGEGEGAGGEEEEEEIPLARCAATACGRAISPRLLLRLLDAPAPAPVPARAGADAPSPAAATASAPALPPRPWRDRLTREVFVCSQACAGSAGAAAAVRCALERRHACAPLVGDGGREGEGEGGGAAAGAGRARGVDPTLVWRALL